MIGMRERDHLVRTTMALSVWFLALAVPIEGGQDSQPAPGETPDQIEQVALEARARALKQWVDDYARWEKRLRDDERRGRTPREVKPKPAPPEWLFEDCRVVPVDDTGLWGAACRLLVDWKDDALTAQVRRQIIESRMQREAPTKTKWWQHVHVDAFWPMTEWGANVYGIVGTHATIELAGRFEVFVAPGAMLLTVPGQRGARELKVATDWGFAYRLTDFRFPGTKRQARLHVNLVTAWVFAGANNLAASRINLAGFSFTFKPPPAPAP